MLQCPSCAESLAESIRICPGCGTSVDSYVTLSGTPPRRASPTPGSGTGSRRDTPDGRFVSGTLFAGRYRIVGPLGRGGMGEVYRADDLRLGQPVALKFLPERLQDDPDRQERLFAEVRLARQVSHPAVCRVYDVGEADGQPFLSMEYVDGEDLASLLRRIGRLPSDKALEIARQLCAGLAAAHDRGVLHRDLKPENVMLDGRGKVRITDFGLAGLAETLRGEDVRSGTPAYMAPEQLSGREATVRSDVYALGLVLYELFTGRRTFGGKSAVELARQHREEDPARPSTLIDDIDPAVERAILRCLEKDPRLRPASALSVAAALPGGDPLAAALAAGETPSPELVAAAGQAEGLSPRVAWTCLLVTAAGIAVFAMLSRPCSLLRLAPVDRSPAALEDRARDLVRTLGYDAKPADARVGFAIDSDYLQYVAQHDRSPHRWDVLAAEQPPVLQFWYRQSQRPLVSSHVTGRVYPNNPPVVESGMAGARFDMQGRLLGFYAVPPQVETAAETGPAVDWAPLLSQAGFDPARFRSVVPAWTPPFYCDARAAWEGTYPDRPDVAVRLEAAAYRGRPVFFEIVAPWTRPDRMQPFWLTPAMRASAMTGGALVLCLLGISGLLARRHLRAGRGDRAGAFRLAGWVTASASVGWLLYASHVADFLQEMGLTVRGLGIVLVLALATWVLYLAVEPYVRRRWPHTLISWARVLAGNVADPRVGGDVLIGMSAGAVMAVYLALMFRLPGLLGQPALQPEWGGLNSLLGSREVGSALIFGSVDAALLGMGLLLMLLLLRLAMPEWLAAVVTTALLSIPESLSSDLPVPMALLLNATGLILPAVVLLRFGLLAAITTIYVVNQLARHIPLARDVGGWTSSPAVLLLLVLGVLAAFAFRAATSRRRG
jgi:eukaryotic-like serine/threonine-protein kinase